MHFLLMDNLLGIKNIFNISVFRSPVNQVAQGILATLKKEGSQ